MITLALLMLAQTPGPPPDPGATARLALRAVESDSVARIEREWAARRDPLAAFGLGMLALYSQRLTEADRRLRAVLNRAPEGSPLDAWTRLGIAGVAYARGEMARADTLYRDAAQRARTARDADAEWEVLLGWAPVRYRQSGSASALEVLARADSLAGGGGAERRFRLRCARAAVGSFSVNEVYHTADSAARAGHVRLAARCLFTAAYQITHQGYGDSASAWLRRVADWQRATRDRSGLATTLQTAGYNELNRGHHAESRQLYAAAIRTGQSSGNGSAVLWATLGMSLLHLTLDDLDAAATFGRRADSLASAVGDRLALAMVRGNLAYRASVAGSPTALAAAHRFREASEPIGQTYKLNALRLIAELEAARGRYAVATAYLDSATAWAETLRSPGDVLTLNAVRARVALRAGDVATALRLYPDVIASSGSPGFRLEARTGHALALLRSGESAAGARLLQAVADSIDWWRSTLSDEQVRRSVFDLRDMMVRASPLALAIVELARRSPPEAALHLAERRRARALLDRLAVARDASAGAGTATALRRTPVPPAAELARLPHPRMTVVEYVLVPDEPGAVLVVSRDGVRAGSVPSGDSLATLVGRFRALIESGTDAAMLGRTIGRMVLDPALALMPADADRIVVVADGALHALPFDALRLDGGRTASERFSFSMAPSLTVAARLWSPRAAEAGGAPRVLALGDPLFPAPTRDGPSAEWHRAFASVGGLPRLAASGAEARALGGFGVPATVRVRRDASEAFLASQDLTPFRIVHLGTHAYVDQRSVTRTALALAPGGGRDGFLTVAELSALRLDADLLTLSSCRTGQGVVAGSEGLQGLVSAAFEAGARAVLASNWTVGDRVAADFTTRFYREAARGRPLDEALAETRRSLIRAGRPAREWAAFTLWGNGLARLPLTTPTSPSR